MHHTTTAVLESKMAYIGAGASFDWFFILEEGVYHCLRWLGHFQRVICKLDRVGKRSPESRKSRSVQKFVFIQEQILRANNATVVPDLACLPVLARERAFLPSLLCDPILERR